MACHQLFIADEFPSKKYVVCFHYDRRTIKIMTWNDWVVILELCLPYNPDD